MISSTLFSKHVRFSCQKSCEATCVMFDRTRARACGSEAAQLLVLTSCWHLSPFELAAVPFCSRPDSNFIASAPPVIGLLIRLLSLPLPDSRQLRESAEPVTGVAENRLMAHDGFMLADEQASPKQIQAWRA